VLTKTGILIHAYCKNRQKYLFLQSHTSALSTALPVLQFCIVRSFLKSGIPSNYKPSVMNPIIKEKIKHVVVLMFENRSFDHLLGAMPGVNGLFDAEGRPRQDVYNLTDPLNPPGNDNPKHLPFAIRPGVSERTYIINPNHGFAGVMADLYGPGTTGVILGQPLNSPYRTYPEINSGFIHTNNVPAGLPPEYPEQYSVMAYFEWESMKVFHRLAKEFVVCDNWFCDFPGHTNPNRAFMHCATTGHMTMDSNTTEVFEPTIFERLESMDKDWKMYIPSNGDLADTTFLNNLVNSKKWPERADNCTDVLLSQFCSDVQLGQLPFYSFICPWAFGGHDPSMHPVSAVEAGENLLAGVYHALRNSPHWEDTLLIVNFDENGGLYDHVRPPAVMPPYPGKAHETVQEASRPYLFDYTSLGPRIPVLLISPWLDKGIDSTRLQNTSILRFLFDLASGFRAHSYLTERDLCAGSVAIALEDHLRQTMREDCPEALPVYQGFVFQDGICNTTGPTEAELQSPPADYIVEIAMEYVTGLPGHPDSNKMVYKPFATTRELLAYLQERKDAAQTYYAAWTNPGKSVAG
jgi:phospholipase C